MKLRHAATVLGLSVAFIVGGGTVAHADDGVDPRIVHALAAQPGGILTSTTTVVWPELGMELAVPSGVTPFALSTKCPTGTICAFQYTGEGGARLSWGACGTYPTTALTSVGSVANARSVGTVQARSGTSVVASTWAGNYTNVYNPTDNIRCY